MSTFHLKMSVFMSRQLLFIYLRLKQATVLLIFQDSKLFVLMKLKGLFRQVNKSHPVCTSMCYVSICCKHLMFSVKVIAGVDKQCNLCCCSRNLPLVWLS